MSTDLPNAPEVQGEPQGTPSKDERTMAMLAHILGIFTSFVGPLIIWLMKKEESAFVNDQGAEALNFQITLAIGYVAAGILSAVGIGCIIYPILGLAALILGIMAGTKANEGVRYRYPVNLRLVK